MEVHSGYNKFHYLSRLTSRDYNIYTFTLKIVLSFFSDIPNLQFRLLWNITNVVMY